MDNKNKLPKLLSRLWTKVNLRRRRQFIIVLFLMLISALTEVISLGAVLPFIGVLVAPEQVYSHPIVLPIAQYFQIDSAKELVLPLTLIFISIALVAGAMRTFILWVSARLGGAIGTDLSFEVYNRTLYQPYSVHLKRNSSNIISGITGKVNSVVSMVLVPVMTLLSSTFLLIGVVSTLFAIDPFIASLSFAGFGGLYGLIMFSVRTRLVANSQLVAKEQTKVVKALQEGLGGIRDVLLDGAQHIYSNVYRQADYPLRRAQANNIFVIGFPRFTLEALGIIFLVVLAYFLSLEPGGINASLPVLGVLAFGAQRLLPALQQLYSSWSTIAGNHESLKDVLELLEQPLPDSNNNNAIIPLKFEQGIHFKNLSFRYANDEPLVLSGINLNIPKGSSVGIVGSTGSGKSTLLDLLMGLIEPIEGSICVDEKTITDQNLREWQNNIAHVPQNIFLTDASIAENIAFGIPLKEIDFERVKRSAQIAQIAKFILGSQEGYSTVVGERGVRLSGGQRQRIGIARSLYKDASILVFDEATSALDNATEELVIRAVNKIEEDLTTFFIAHRLTTIKDCDIVIELKDGKVVAQGTYTELLEQSSSFRGMNANVQ